MKTAPSLRFYTLKLPRRGWRISDAVNGADNCIMEERTELLDGLISGIGPGSVGEEGDGKLTLRVAPEGGSGVSEMAEGAWGKPGA
jgi:hypothetical protein